MQTDSEETDYHGFQCMHFHYVMSNEINETDTEFSTVHQILHFVGLGHISDSDTNLDTPCRSVGKVDAWLWVALHLEIQQRHSNLQVAPAPLQSSEWCQHWHIAPSLNTPHKPETPHGLLLYRTLTQRNLRIILIKLWQK